MQNIQQNASASRSAAHRSPNAGAVGIVFTALFATSLVAVAVMSGGGHFPSPFDAPELSQRFFTEHADAVRIGALLQFGSAIPLGIFTVTVVSRLKYLGMNMAGVDIALFGGIAAAIGTLISGLAQWVLSQPGVAADMAVMRAFHMLAFASGGPGYVVPLGLLLAGISVPSLFGRLLPRWLAWIGLIVAGVAMLSTFSLVFTPATYLLPIARFTAYIWIIATGFMLPRARG